jgi:hypothetical protein
MLTDLRLTYRLAGGLKMSTEMAIAVAVALIVAGILLVTA